MTIFNPKTDSILMQSNVPLWVVWRFVSLDPFSSTFSMSEINKIPEEFVETMKLSHVFLNDKQHYCWLIMVILFYPPPASPQNHLQLLCNINIMELDVNYLFFSLMSDKGINQKYFILGQTYGRM